MKTAFKVTVYIFTGTMWALWIAGALWNYSEQVRVDREARQQIQTYNRSIEMMEATKERIRR